MLTEYNEPWDEIMGRIIVDIKGNIRLHSQTDRERVLACVNACAGIPTRDLVKLSEREQEAVKLLREYRDAIMSTSYLDDIARFREQWVKKLHEFLAAYDAQVKP